jgi:hypothetical protein
MSQTLENTLNLALRRATHSHIHGCDEGPAGGTAVYTLADPRDARSARYVGQTRDPKRRYRQHVRAARLWLSGNEAAIPWWIRSPRHGPLYAWIRELHQDGGRLPFMWVEQWLEPGDDALVAERAAIMRLLTQGAALLNVEARLSGAQLPLL